MIKFELIRWINFLSTGNAWNEVVLNKNATTLIVGANGHGKSTLLDALTFALFGKPFRDTNKPNLVNTINKKGCLVELPFTIGTKRYLIRRGIAPAVFEIYIDGVIQDQDAIAGDYQTYLEDHILKFNYKAFTQIVILGSKSFVPFMKLKSADRRAIIENLLDIEVFSSMNEIAKDQFKKIVKDIATNKTNMDNTKQKIALQQKYVEDAKKQSQELVQVKNAEKAVHQSDISKLCAKEEELEEKIDKLDRLISYEEVFRTKYNRFIKEISDHQRDIEKYKQDIDFLDKHVNCPTCRQDILPENKASLKNEANAGIIAAEFQIQEKQKELKKWSDSLQQIKKHMEEHSQISHELDTIHMSKKFHNKAIDKLQAEIVEILNKKPLSDDMMQISKDLVNELENLNTERARLLEDQPYYQAAIGLLKDDGIKAQIIKQYLPVINREINKYLVAMDFFVQFELDEEFNETIKSRHRDEFSYGSFSEGEKQKIDIALLFAWRDVAKLKNSVNTNLLIMDEIFDSSLDSNGADMVFSILSTLPHDSNVFIISHRDLLQDRFAATIKFEKRNNFSEIVDVES